MRGLSLIVAGRMAVLLVVLLVVLGGARAQRSRSKPERLEDQQFGPVVQAYLAYLRSEQEVVDDRASRHEVSPLYYRHNLNRIRALRRMAINIARSNNNDYIPELEAVSRNEFGRLFDAPPDAARLHSGDVIDNTFRFLGTIHSAEVFYIFERLDPYEQSELANDQKARKALEPSESPLATTVANHSAAPGKVETLPEQSPASDAAKRPRRVATSP